MSIIVSGSCIITFILLAYGIYIYYANKQTNNDTILRIVSKVYNESFIDVDKSDPNFQKSMDLINIQFNIIARLEEKKKTMNIQQAEDQLVEEIKQEMINRTQQLPAM
jgi:hypothetical protein